MGNPLVHFEILVSNTDKAKEFYSNLFDWQITSTGAPDYLLIHTGKEPGGGLMRTGPDMEKGINIYLQVDDVERYLARAEELGGKVLVPKSEVPEVGWFGLFADPEGNVIGLFQPVGP